MTKKTARELKIGDYVGMYLEGGVVRKSDGMGNVIGFFEVWHVDVFMNSFGITYETSDGRKEGRSSENLFSVGTFRYVLDKNELNLIMLSQ